MLKLQKVSKYNENDCKLMTSQKIKHICGKLKEKKKKKEMYMWAANKRTCALTLNIKQT